MNSYCDLNLSAEAAPNENEVDQCNGKTAAMALGTGIAITLLAPKLYKVCKMLSNHCRKSPKLMVNKKDVRDIINLLKQHAKNMPVNQDSGICSRASKRHRYSIGTALLKLVPESGSHNLHTALEKIKGNIDARPINQAQQDKIKEVFERAKQQIPKGNGEYDFYDWLT